MTWTIPRFTLHIDQRDGPYWCQTPDGPLVRYADHENAMKELAEAFQRAKSPPSDIIWGTHP